MPSDFRTRRIQSHGQNVLIALQVYEEVQLGRGQQNAAGCFERRETGGDDLIKRESVHFQKRL